MKAKGKVVEKGLGIPDCPMKCARCRIEGMVKLAEDNLSNGWMYLHFFTAAKRWSAAFLCPDCAPLFELWMEEA